MNRREMMSTALGLGAALSYGTFLSEAFADSGHSNKDPSVGSISKEPYTLPKLPYAYDALEPVIDESTMKLHHTKHHQGYVNGLKTAETALEEARNSGSYQQIEYWSKKWSFNAGGHFLHSLFWECMRAPKDSNTPGGLIMRMIKKDFGTFERMKAHFSAAAAQVEGGGWGLLLYSPNRDQLFVAQAENQHKLTDWGSTPVLGIDVWEHAYYLKYNNRRTDYINAWWQLVNWDQVEQNVKLLMKK